MNMVRDLGMQVPRAVPGRFRQLRFRTGWSRSHRWGMREVWSM